MSVRQRESFNPNISLFQLTGIILMCIARSSLPHIQVASITVFSQHQRARYRSTQTPRTPNAKQRSVSVPVLLQCASWSTWLVISRIRHRHHIITTITPALHIRLLLLAEPTTAASLLSHWIWLHVLCRTPVAIAIVCALSGWWAAGILRRWAKLFAYLFVEDIRIRGIDRWSGMP